jgi:cytochrome P450 family 135
MVRDPVGFLERCRQRYGPIFRVRFVGFTKYVYVGDPALAREVYAADRDVGRAGEARRDFLARLVGDNSLLCTEGDQWLRQRKLVGPAFHRRHVEGYREEIATIAGEQIDRWPTGQPLELRDRMQAITLDVILRLVFGITDADRVRRLRHLLPKLLEAGGSLLMWIVPPPVWERFEASKTFRRLPANPISAFLRVREEVDALVYDEIHRRRSGSDGTGGDVLSLMIRTQDEDGRSPSDVELRDQLLTLLMAGHETTATALAWAFERLLRTPRALERLTRELENGDEEYLDAVVKETLRSRPVVLDTPRLLAGPLELGGYEIPAGWYVAPAMPLVHTDAAVHPDPDDFRPERFLGEDAPRDAWIPFGGGKRHCVGSHLALLELKVVITEVLRRVQLEAVRPEAERARVRHVTLVPSDGGLAVARPRADRPLPAAATAPHS